MVRPLRIATLVFLASCRAALAVVDERPLPVEIVPAFAELTWPQWLIQPEAGRVLEPRPLLLTGAQDGTNRVFLVSQYGVIFVFNHDRDAHAMDVFLDLRDQVQYADRENEEGLLGIAFHPQYRHNGEFYVYYTQRPTPEERHTSVISRFRVSPDDPNRADTESEVRVMTIRQPFWNHNGGTLVFGPDGYLYIGLGDGGAAGDPFGNGQNLATLLGKILRIDVDRRDVGREYAIPADNPFAGRDDARGEIWAFGLRNVWRMAFDRVTGTCWAGDVGQDTWEEIDLIERGGNYGWNLREGKHPFGNRSVDPSARLIEPIWEYHHDVGKSITGGCVYRGKAVPELQGAYLYADFVSGQIWALWYDADQKEVTANRTIVPSGQPVMSFGEDDAGEVYFVTQNGGIFRFQSAAVTSP